MKIELTLDSTVQIASEVVSCDLVDEAAILLILPDFLADMGRHRGEEQQQEPGSAGNSGDCPAADESLQREQQDHCGASVASIEQPMQELQLEEEESVEEQVPVE